MERSYLTLGALGLALLLGLIRLLRVGRRPKGYPPGPPTIPVLGNLHLVRTISSLATYDRQFLIFMPDAIEGRASTIPEMGKDLLGAQSSETFADYTQQFLGPGVRRRFQSYSRDERVDRSEQR
jgi:hypothetical protein